MLAAEREKLSRLLANYIGWDRAKLVDITQGAKVPTKAGLLWVHFDVKNYGAIFCRFEDPDAARKVLHGDEQIYPGAGQRLNPHSGKWNFHFGQVSADDAIHEFDREFAKVAVEKGR